MVKDNVKWFWNKIREKRNDEFFIFFSKSKFEKIKKIQTFKQD